MNNVDLLQTWFRRVWQEQDATAIDEMLAPDAKVRGLGAHVNLGPEQFRPFVKSILALVRDLTIEIDRTMEDGPWLHALITVRGHACASGRPVVFPGQVLIRTGNGKILEGYNSIDFLALFEQLELLPERVFDTCLSGARAY